MTSARILVGDVRERLRDLPDGSVHCAVTSPPYFGGLFATVTVDQTTEAAE